MEENADSLILQHRPPPPDSELRRLEPLIGKWKAKDHTQDSILGPGVPVINLEEFYWLEGGYFLVQAYDTTFGDEPAQKGINYWFYDTEAQKLRIIFFSNNGPYSEEGNRYEGEIPDDKLTFTGPARFQYELDTDGKIKVNPDGTVTVTWWLRDEAGTWQPWMTNTFSRVKWAQVNICSGKNMKYLIPESLETDRLILRTFRESDWRDLHAYYSDEVCTRYTIGRALTEGETWRAMAALVGHWQLRQYGSYALENKVDHKVLGFAGLDYPNDWPEPEIQWALCREYWGRGYASEAVRAVKKMADQYLPDLSLISLIHPANTNSIRLAEAVGAHFEREHEFRGAKWSIYSHTKKRRSLSNETHFEQRR